MTGLADLLAIEPHYQWLVFAGLLALLEIVVPGVFLIWISAAAALTGIASWATGMPVVAQLLLFAALSLASAWIGRRWYLANPGTIADPLLNDRAARMVGQTVTVVEPVSDHGGRVRVGDSEWPARGPEMPRGAVAWVVTVRDGVLVVAPRMSAGDSAQDPAAQG